MATRLGQITAELNTVADLALIGTTPPTISSTEKRTGSYSYRTSATGSAFGFAFAATDQIRAGAWVWHNGGSGQPPLITIPVDDVYVRLLFDAANNTLQLLAGFQQGTGTARYPIADVSAGPLANQNQWVHVGVVYRCAASGGFLTVYVDGVALMSWTGDTRVYDSSSATPEPADIVGCYAAGSRITSQWTNYIYIDDFYVDDATGDGDAPVPGRRFLVALANGAGTNTEMTPVGAATNYEAVADPLSAENDGDTTYVKALAANLTDTYQMSSITLPADYGIRAAIPVVVARKLDATDVQVSLVQSDGTNEDVGTAQDISTSYGVVWERFTLQPDGSEWTEEDFNGMEFGQRSAGSYS